MMIRSNKPRSRDITKIIEDVVAKVYQHLEIVFTDYNEQPIVEPTPSIGYVFGNAKYIKSYLEEMSFGQYATVTKLPLIALFTPILEDRSNPDYHTVAKVNILIACKTNRAWNNEQRREYSFVNVLRPIYERFMDELKADSRLDFGYNETIKHSYSENYSYGKYGAYTSTGEELSEPIDAIDIRNLELKIKKYNCRTQ